MSLPPGVKISDLSDVTNTQTPDAQVAISQDGTTFRGRVRPNPPFQINVTSQTQLEAKFGTGILIPAGESWTIVIDGSFTLTKPIMIGNNSSLELYGSTVEIRITYQGLGAIFQNENLSNPILTLNIHNIDIDGQNSNDIFDIATAFVVIMEDVIFNSFDKTGTIASPFLDFRFTALQGVNSGLIIKNLINGIFNGFNLNQSPSAPALTFITILSSGTSAFTMSNCFVNDTASSVLFLDPNSSAGAAYVIEKTTGFFTDLFQAGTDIAINSVADNGSGKCRFTTASPHGLSEHIPVVISGFVTQTSYNQTGLVLGVPASATEFDVDIAFVATDTGNMNKSSLASTDILVTAKDNPGQQNSMTTGSASLQLASPITVTINTQDVPEVISDVGWVTNNLERFTEDTVTPNQGRLIANVLSARRYAITYSATINRSGGGGVDIGIVLLKNGGIVGVNPPRAFTTTITPLTRTDIVELTTDDVIQVAVINYNGTADIDVYQTNMSILLPD